MSTLQVSLHFPSIHFSLNAQSLSTWHDGQQILLSQTSPERQSVCEVQEIGTVKILISNKEGQD